MPRPVLITTLALSALAALAGFWMGQNRGDLTDRVNAVAHEHVRVHGGAVSDCFGWVVPGDDAVRVTCGAVVYGIDDLGRVFEVERPDA